MPNPIKYSTGSESDALKKGNMYIGTGSVGKGPSDVTGYYQGPTIPSGGYVVYMYKEDSSSNLSYHVIYNDSELISFTNSLAGQSYTTVSQSLEYYATQNDKFITNIDYPSTFPYIVMDELLCYYDSNISDSYPNNGNTWYDISGNGNNVSMNAVNPTFSTLNGIKCFKTDDSVGQGFTGNLKGGKFPSKNATLESWVYANPTNLTQADRGCIILLTNNGIYQSWNLNNNKLSNYWYSHNPEGYFEPSSSLVRQTWLNLTSVWNYDTSSLKQYVNGSLVSTHTTQGDALSAPNLRIGFEGCCGGRNFPGYISVIRIYSKPLTDSEVLNNFNVQKTRFGYEI